MGESAFMHETHQRPVAGCKHCHLEFGPPPYPADPSSVSPSEREIEAVARAMYEGAHRRWAIDPKTTRWPGAHKSVSFDALDKGIRCAYLDEAVDAVTALDRVRDARGDDEGREVCSWCEGSGWLCDGCGRPEVLCMASVCRGAALSMSGCPKCFVPGECGGRGWVPARSPQGENHEADVWRSMLERIRVHGASGLWSGEDCAIGAVAALEGGDAARAFMLEREAARSPQGEDHDET